MTRAKNQFYWHIHHDVLLEPLTEPISFRRAFIKKHKPKKERALRLRLMKPVKGKLSETFVKAAWKVCFEAGRAYAKARNAYSKEINALHKKECPKCPWSSKEQTIFPKLRNKTK